MTNDEFFEQFGHLAEAPDGIARLKRLILDLAVRGRLVPQDPSDEPASVLLERIAEERERLLAEKGARKNKPRVMSMEGNGLGWALPVGWVEVRFPTLGSWAGGTGFPKRFQGLSEGRFLFCKVSDMNRAGNERSIFETENRVDEAAAEEMRALVHPPGTVIFPKIGGAVATNKRRILMQPTIIDNNCLGITPSEGVLTEWLYILLLSIDMAELANEGPVPAVSQKSLAGVVLGLPPTAEQRRIVTGVEELMALCDELEERRVEAQELRAATARSSLSALVESDRSDTEQALTIIKDHLRLSLRPGDGAAEVVTELRRAILDLAVRGRLVPQDPSDEPASVLLERIAAERERLVAEKKMRKGKPLPEFEVEELPYRLPDGWEWTRIADVTSECRRGRTPSYEGGTTPVVNQKCVRHHTYVDLQFARRTNESVSPLPDWAILQEGDVLINSTGAGTLGRVGWIREPVERITADTHVSIIRPISGLLSEFLGWSLHAWEDTLVSMGTGTTKQTELNSGLLRALHFACPPVEEQRRVVGRIEELMDMCDELEQRFLGERGLAADLADSAVNSLVAQVA